MKTGIFNNKFDPKIVFFSRIYRNYDLSKKDDVYIKDILQRFLYNQYYLFLKKTLKIIQCFFFILSYRYIF